MQVFNFSVKKAKVEIMKTPLRIQNSYFYMEAN